MKIDTDKDEIPDAYEKYSLRTNPKDSDTEDDGLTDLEETGYMVWIKKESGNDKGIKGYRTFFRNHI